MTSMTDALDRTIAFVRSLGTRLRPGVLDFGLPEAIEWQADEFQHRTGIQCKILSKPETLAISEDRSTAVFRIFQEILTNIARHADASGVKIRLHQQGNHLVLQVTDNGKGIREGAMHQPGHFGILGMRERALTFGGEVIIKPAPKKGTGVRVKIPIRRNKNEHSDCR